MSMCSCRNGTSCHHPNLWTTTTHQFAVLHRRDFGALICRRALDSSAWETFDLSLIPGNPFELPIDSLDSHEELALCVDGLGYLHIAGGQHSDSMSHYVQSAAPGVIDRWVPGTVPDLSGSGNDQHTYHLFNAFDDGTVLWFFDQQEGDTGRGRDWILLRRAPAATSWERLGGLAPGMTGPYTELAVSQNTPDGVTVTTDMDRVYLFRPVIDTAGRLHLFGCWRADTEEPNTQRDCFYVYSDDMGTTFNNVHGEPQALPLTYTAMQAGCRVANQPAYSRNYGGVTTDPDNHPMVILQNGGASPEEVAADPSLAWSGPSFMRVWWTGSEWMSMPANRLLDGRSTPAVTGTPLLAAMDGDIYYLGARLGSYWAVNLTTGEAARFGDAPVRMEAHADPMALRQGRVEVLVPDGDTPTVHSVGQNAKCRA